GQYTYEIASGEEDVEPQVVTVDVVLQGVTVNKNKPSIAYFGENIFSDDMNPETEDAPIEGQTDFPTIKRYDLPTEITNPGAQPPFVDVYNDGQVVIYQVNLALGYLWIETTVYDPGYAKFTLLDLQQKEVAKMIDENVTGVYQGTAEAEPGFYYLVTETSNVAFNWTTWR
ncbi:MAG: hypothetical protein IJ875_00470, partial [Solobacterium sp.]|nr:hypothetical protein [Solobacterium sp.]